MGQKRENEKSVGGDARVDSVASSEPTLDELAQKLSELRQHLEQVLRGLNRGAPGARIGDSLAAESSLQCHACSRTGSSREAGWTLRLCGDDELHPFCPDCDHREVDAYDENETRVRTLPQGVHQLPALGEASGL